MLALGSHNAYPVSLHERKLRACIAHKVLGVGKAVGLVLLSVLSVCTRPEPVGRPHVGTPICALNVAGRILSDSIRACAEESCKVMGDSFPWKRFFD